MVVLLQNIPQLAVITLRLNLKDAGCSVSDSLNYLYHIGYVVSRLLPDTGTPRRIGMTECSSGALSHAPSNRGPATTRGPLPSFPCPPPTCIWSLGRNLGLDLAEEVDRLEGGEAIDVRGGKLVEDGFMLLEKEGVAVRFPGIVLREAIPRGLLGEGGFDLLEDLPRAGETFSVLARPFFRFFLGLPERTPNEHAP